MAKWTVPDIVPPRKADAPPPTGVVAVLRTLGEAVALGGGGVRALQAAWRVVRYEGWRGVRLRLAIAAQRAGAGWLVPMMPADDLGWNYSVWVNRFDRLGRAERKAIAARIAALPRRPLISVVMPTFDTPEPFLRKAIESVQGQLYPNWELCIADDASTAPHVRVVLQGYADRDPRIRVELREANGHISAASNTALALASGEFVAMLDHDDELTADALARVALEIAAFPDAALIYSDEDKIDASGRRTDPNFKPDWNEDLSLSYNLVTHLAVYRTARLRAIGGFRLGLEGSQDYDAVLRFVDGLDPARIRHIPKVLYHWRMHAASVAQNPGAKDYAVEAARRAIGEHLARRGVAGAEVLPAPGAPNLHRVRYALPPTVPRVTLIMPTRNRHELLRACVESILEQTDYASFDIIVVDNGSDEPEALAYLAALPRRGPIRVLRDDAPFNYARLNNAAVREAQGEVVGLLNNDLEAVDAGWLREMVSHAVRPGVGAVGARLWYPDGRLQHGGVVLGLGGVAGHSHKLMPKGELGYKGRAVLLQSFSAVTGACLLVRRAIYNEVGGLDERLAIAFNDIDFCLRVRAAGYRNVWTPYAELIHHESISRGLDDTPEKKARFASEVAIMRERWGELLLRDPAYNPNLTLKRQDFSLAWPPRRSGAGG